MGDKNINKQTPDSYNADEGKSILWQEAIDKGYVKGGVDGESTKNNTDTSNE